jgi:hypothetical protein
LRATWPAYAREISEHFARHLTATEARTLTTALERPRRPDLIDSLTNDLCGLDVIDQEAIEVAGRALRPAAYLPGPVLAGDNANLNDDREAAIDESKRSLDLYYTTDFVR